MNQKFSQTPPTDPGLYWVWQPPGTWPATGVAYSVEVKMQDNVLCAWVPFTDSADPVIPRDDTDTWVDAWCLDPIERPAAPSV